MSADININGYRVGLTDHAVNRMIERFKALSISFPDNESYIDLGLCGISEVLNNPFMDKYIYNLMVHSHHRNEDVLVYDTLNKMVYAFSVKPYNRRIVVKTVGTERTDEWLYENKYQRICWIYDNVFKFSTIDGNVTWF